MLPLRQYSPIPSTSPLARLSTDYQFSSPNGSEYRFSRYKHSSRHRWLYISCASLAAVSLFGLIISVFWTSQVKNFFSGNITTIPVSGDTSFTDTQLDLTPARYINGPPTARFRDNLKQDEKYITSWVAAGWTNDVMTYMNLIYLGLITERIPILPMFTPSHIGGSVPPIDFGEVFDMSRLRSGLKKPVLEWHQVKDRNSTEIDELGCWNVWEAVQEREAFPRNSFVPVHLKLDISYTKAPSWIKVIPNYVHDMHSYFWALASLAFPETRASSLVPPLESPEHHVLLPPDQQLLCYDYLYYVCANQPFEFDFDYSPAWRFVGQHMRWTPKIVKLADEYVRKAIGLEEGQNTPKWIAVHVRHGDFANWCGDVAVLDCFAPISVIARRVNEVKSELRETRGIDVNHVIVTSDEKDDDWWTAVKAQGWYKINHSDTADLYGAWYPVLIDAAIQSGGVGFVGTDRSTMSILARRRTESWQNGVTRTFKWGTPDSDAH